MCDSVEQLGFAGIYPILEEKVPLEVAMQPDFAASNVEKTVKKICTYHKFSVPLQPKIK
jgi:hypothetical protein